MFDGSDINLFIAFIAGIITFFASCLLPLVPAYLAFLSGTSSSNLGKANKPTISKDLKKEVFTNGVFFTLGFILVFTILGATANTLGNIFAVHRDVIQQFGGLFFIILGLFMLGAIHPMLLLKERRVTIPSKLLRWKKAGALLVGGTFGFAWTPCIGPVLAVILFWASQTESFWYGMGLLTLYGIGLGIPFLIVGALFGKVAPQLYKASAYGNFLHILSGLMIIIVGVLMLLNKIQYISILIINALGLDEGTI